MKTKLAVATAVAVTLGVLGTAQGFAQHAASKKATAPSTAIDPAAAQEKGGPPEGRAPKHRAPNAGWKNAFLAEFSVGGKDGEPIRKIRIDRGEFVSADGATLVIKNPGGEVSIDTTDAKVGRNGSKATLADFVKGDLVMATTEDGKVVGVRAISKEKLEERKAKRSNDPAAKTRKSHGRPAPEKQESLAE